jgi:hypothetical protein
MDSLRTVQENAKLKHLSPNAKASYIGHGVTRNGFLFGSFFAGFHTLKYTLRTYLDPGDWGEILGAGTVSLAAILYKPQNRPALPYCFMLIGMDTFQLLFREPEDGGGAKLGVKRDQGKG